MKAAVWYWRHHVVQVDIGEAEDAIAGVRVSSDMGECAPEGVQYEDGTYNDWRSDPIVKRQKAEEQRRWEADWEEQKSKPPPPVWEIEAPFTTDRGAAVTARFWGEKPPAWVGKARVARPT